MGSLVPLARGRSLLRERSTRRRQHHANSTSFSTTSRLRGMTPAERQAALRSLARLLLEASGVATREAGDDHA